MFGKQLKLAKIRHLKVSKTPLQPACLTSSNQSVYNIFITYLMQRKITIAKHDYNVCFNCFDSVHVVNVLVLFVQVSVTVYPEHGLSDQHIIPWWIILIAVLAGIIVLALLVCILWKVGVHTHTLLILA